MVIRTVEYQIRKLVKRYERGIFSKCEFDRQLIDWAAHLEFFDHIDLVPDHIQDELRDTAWRGPAHPEDCVYILTGNYDPETDLEAVEREHRELVYWGCRRLREHFFPGESAPHFQPITMIGVVQDAMIRQGAVAVFGDLETDLVRRHPIQLVLPNGRKIHTCAVDMGFMKSDRDKASEDEITREYGRIGLMFDANVESTSDVPPGTEVWVDRTAAGALPDPPRLPE